MQNSKVLKLLVWLILAIGLFIFINKCFFKNEASFGFIPQFGQGIASSIFVQLSKTQKIIISIRNIFDLINKNTQLENKNKELLSQLAGFNDLKSENTFLKKAARISEDIAHQFKEAGIYTWSLGPDGYSVLLNKGSRDGISQGDIIVSEERVLIGMVREVGKDYSKVLVTTDPGFRITAKILNSDTIGIASGVLDGEIKFDLIVRDDKINEGDVVVSSGNDTFPPSLVIGKVSKVNLAEDQLFKQVTIKPAIDGVIIGRVMVIVK